MLVHGTPYLTVSYDAALRRLELCWSGEFTPSRCFRPLLDSIQQFIVNRRPTRWLCDHGAMRIISPEDQAWLFERWMPVLCAGWHEQPARVAVVKASDLFGLRSTLNVAQRLQQRRCLDVELFDARGDAEQWLLTGSHPPKGPEEC
ncbi:MAG TPA: hypothetical protein VHB79_31280 [Polyangiaceae bacterium]|nr:hypothetical protein [Polyangiaceae bacterium]